MTDVLLVLGVHRSGTSSVAGVLNLLGAAAPKTLMPADAGNERGYCESVPLWHFHDEILDSAGSAWDDWRAFNPSWYTAPAFADFTERALWLFKGEFGESTLAVLKDPRICRFVPFWLDVLGKMKAQPRIVIPVRSPMEVARSLKLRDGFPLTKGLLIWLRHVLDAEAVTRTLPRAIFSWNEFLADWRNVTEKISALGGISWPRLSDRTSKAIDEFLSRDLKHHRVEDKEFVHHPDAHEWARSTYQALLLLAEQPDSNNARTLLDDVRSLFERACSLFGRVTLDYELAFDAHQSEAQALRADREHWLVQYRQIEGTLRHTREEKDHIATLLSQRTGEVQAVNNALAELARHKDEIAAALHQSQAEKNQLAAQFGERIAQLEALLGDQRSAAERWQREQETIAVDLRSQLIDREAKIAYTQRTSSIRSVLGNFRPRHVARQLLRSDLFDVKWYLDRYHDAIEDGLDPAVHYVQHGFCRGYFPHPLFDTRYYLEHNEDVRRSGVNPLLHYLLHGHREGRNPNPYFDGLWYLDTYTDVAVLGINPLLHYATAGCHEGRDPSTAFNTEFYLKAYPDVRESGMNPLAHFIHFGCQEGRIPALHNVPVASKSSSA
jgi:hypothetical protein